MKVKPALYRTGIAARVKLWDFNGDEGVKGLEMKEALFGPYFSYG
jgi:hypothetical protein